MLFSVFLISCGGSDKNNTDALETNGSKQTEQGQTKKTGWIKDNNENYFLNSSGIMQKGWIKDNVKNYYCDDYGVMQTGWKEIYEEWYYFLSDGSMAVNQFIDGYYLTYSGAMQTSSSNDSNVTNSVYNSGAISNKRGKIAYIPDKGYKYHRIPDCGGINPKRTTKTTVAEAEREG
jgi:hypothetical protein